MEKLSLHTNVQFLKGVGPVKDKALQKIGVYEIKDLLSYYPREYEDRTVIKRIDEFIPEQSVLFIARVEEDMQVQRMRNKLSVCRMYVTDSTQSCLLVWFNQDYLANFFKRGQEYLFYGKVELDRGMFKIEGATVYGVHELEEIKGFYPIYPLTYGISQKYLFHLITEALKLKETLPEIFSESFRKKYDLCSIFYATQKIHHPKTQQEINIARKRLIFEELFMLTLALQMLKNNNDLVKKKNEFDDMDCTPFLELLPFHLTNAQTKVIEEIKKDMRSKQAMNRMIQGDVGSGKTMVAAISLYLACKNGYQGAMMAPTTILANQHYLELFPYFEKLGYSCEIMTSTTTKKQKQLMMERLRQGKIDILFGTHSLIEDNVIFQNLGIVITDEQHRFGVKHRMKLSDKGQRVETLVMTATPIPRTLGLMLYGDLDLSIIDELPPGRKKIATFAVDNSYEHRINVFIAKEIEKGRQVYVVCPLVEESEISEMKSVTQVYEEYTASKLNQYGIAMIHGKMKAKEKDEIMQKFKNNEIAILISTTVIEVGVNVPNATIMVIESAERFGLAALHQLRGRVGRGEHESFCILKSSVRYGKVMERLKIMEKSNNGFEIAEKDLELRGPGEFFGYRQNGLPEFKLADMLKDMQLLQLAQIASKALLQEDSNLEREENKALKESIYSKYGEQLTNIGM